MSKTQHHAARLYCAALLLCSGLVLGGPTARAQDASETFTMDDLLEQVRQGRVQDKRNNAERLRSFKQQQAEQQNRLAELKQQEQQQQALSEEREQQFEQNDQTLTLLNERLTERLGSLKELFGVLQQVSSDAHAQFHGSLTQLEFPGRTEYLLGFANKMGQTEDLPSIEEIERLWFELQREMIESGRVVHRRHAVVTREGEEQQQDVVRVGTFNLVADGRYLQFVPETGRVLEYARQPADRFMSGARAIAEQSEATVAFTVDPTRGQLLGLLVAAPKLSERIAQGGVIGYVILALGTVALVLALVRMLLLGLAEHRIRRQIRSPDESGDNPLGRILKEYTAHRERDLETLELKMGEAVMREVPKINRGLAFLKIIAAVAPLLGLLGTVTGMIITFQSIVLFGAGDPKMMAGGISQALVTTVLGLVVAIPTLLMHNLVQTRARAITEVLEQEAVAMVAVQAEQQNSGPQA